MAIEPIYRARSTSQTTALPMASPDAFGAPLARAAADVDALWERMKLQRKKQEAVDKQVEMATARGEHAKAEAEARATAGPGAAGYADGLLTSWDERIKPILESTRDPEVRQQLTVMSAQHRASLQARSAEWEIVERGKYTVSQVEREMEITENNMKGPTVTAEMLRGELDLSEAQISALALPDAVKQPLIQERQHRAARGWLRGLVERDPDQAKALIESGVFNSYLKPDTLETLQREAGVEMRAREAQAKAEVATARAQVREAATMIEKRLAAGEDVPLDEIRDVAGKAAAAGLTGEVYDLRVAEAQQGINRETMPWKATEYGNEINRLEGKGDARTPEEDIRLKHIRSIQAERERRFREDPGGWAASNGSPPPDLDLNDPRTVRAWTQWHDAVEKQTRHAPGLPPELVQDWQAMAKGPPAKRVELAAQLQALPPSFRLQAARQIDPDDTLFQHIVTLRNPIARELALQGGEARKINPAIFNEREAAEAFEGGVGRAFSAMPPGYAGNVRATADAIYSSIAQRSGLTAFDPKIYAKAISAASEQSMAVWRGAMVAVPGDMSPDDFVTRLARWNSTIPAGASNGKPVNANGSPMSVGFVKDSLTPRAVGNGRYIFVDRTGAPARTEEGLPWVMDIRRLPAPRLDAKPAAAADTTKAMPAVVPLRRPDGPQAVWGAPR